MSNSLEFSEDFWEWLDHIAKASPSSYRPPRPTRTEDGNLYLVMNGGEIVHYFDLLQDGWVRYSWSERNSGPKFKFDFADMEYVEKYLCVDYANQIRRILGLSNGRREEFIDPRVQPDMISERFTSRIIPWQGPIVYERPLEMRVFSTRCKDYFRVSYLPPHLHRFPITRDSAVGLTWYIDKPLPEVLASLRNPTGAPLFELLRDHFA